MARTRHRSLGVALAVAVCALAACKTTPPTTTPKPPTASSKPKVTGSATPATPVALVGPTRTVAEPLVTAAIIGKIRLLSDQGGGIISNNSGAIISDNGGGLVSNNGGSLVSNNGGGIIGKIRYALDQATGPAAPAAEALLADAIVEVLDAEGRRLLDPAGKPITATTDAAGAYKLTARLPAGNLMLRVRLFPDGKLAASGGELRAILPVAAGARTQDVDTASSLGATYVLDRYVKGRQAVFDKLPAAEADALQRDMGAARTLLGAVPTYQPTELVDLAEGLRAKAPALDQTLERIKAILLAGQSELGDGQQATTVALSNPFGVVADVRTNPPTLYIGETGRIRRVTAAGLIERFAGGLTTSNAFEGDALQVTMDSPGNLAIAADGTLYAADYVSNKVYRIRDGQLTVVAGTGARLQGPPGGKARETPVKGPSSICLAPDGKIYFGEFPKTHDQNARILFINPDGTLGELDNPFTGKAASLVTGLVLGPDGAFYVLNTEVKQGDEVWRRDPATKAWSLMASNIGASDTSRLAIGPDGALYATLGVRHQVVRVNPDGTKAVVVGTGRPGDGGDGGPSAQASVNEPSALWFAPDGTLYVADLGNALIRRITGKLDGTGMIETVAGTRAATQLGDALTLSLNTPTALTIDPAGRVVVCEGTGGTIKRLEGSRLNLIAGSLRGYAGDGGPALQAQFDSPGGLAYAGDALYVIDSANRRIRRISADGTVETVVGGNVRAGFMKVRRLSARDAGVGTPIGAAVGPDGTLYWCDNMAHQVLHLTAAGEVEVLAGGLDGQPGDAGDGGLAIEARFSYPSSVAVDKQGTVYVADTGNARIRRIGPDGRIDTVAGVPFGEVLTGLGDKAPEPSAEADARQGWLLAPVALALDAKGELFVAELGSTRIGTFIGALGLSLDPDALPRKGSRIRKVSGLAAGKPTMRTIAGEGAPLLAGPSSDNGLLVPLGLAIDGEGRLIIADSGTNQIKLLPAAAL